MRLSICDEVPEDWQIKNIETVCKRVTSGGTPSRKNSAFYQSGKILWVKTKELNDDIIYSTEECITEEATLKSSAKVLPVNTVLLAMYGATVGKLGILGKEAACNQACCAMIADERYIDYRYLYYQLLAHKETIKSLATGAAQQNLSGVLIKSLELPFPILDEQKDIADVLWSLDRKIEVNRRMNETLEAMARAVFKSWFVDFDPVRAKAAGRQPEGMNAETAALFPSAFTDDGLPLGWAEAVLGDIAENPRTQTRLEEVSSDTPYIGLEHMPRRSIALHEWESAEKVSSNKSAFVSGDFLFGKLRPYFHKVGIAAIDGICSTDILIIRPKRPEFYAFVLSLISSDEFVDYTHQLSNGARMPRTNWRDMAKYPLVLPDVRVALAYNKLVKPMLAQIIANIHESRTLSELRDTLLPKLISGQLRISDVEQQIQEAVG